MWLYNKCLSVFLSSPIRHPRSSTPRQEDRRRDTYPNLADIKGLPTHRAVHRLAHVCESCPLDYFLEKAISILSALDSGDRRPIAQGLMDAVPVRARAQLVIKLMHSGIIHSAYLQSLTVLGQHLGGPIILDQLTQTHVDSRFLFEYLSCVSKDDARTFMDMAEDFLGRAPEHIRDLIRHHPHFPDDYANNADIDTLFTDARIGSLISLVAANKGLTPSPAVRRGLLDTFLQELRKQFEDGYVHTNDALSMIKQAISHLDLGMAIAVDCLRESFHALAVFLAEENNLTPPALPDSDSDLRFIDQPCPPTHSDLARVMLNVKEAFIVTEGDIQLLINQLKASQCVTLMHHEPPEKLPGAPRMDMLSIRTNDYVFHIPTVNNRLLRYAINWLKEFNYDRIIYARNPHGLIRILTEVYGWHPHVTDIKPDANRLVNKPNSNFSDIARFLFQVSVCWRARWFSAHFKPSRSALRHESIRISLVHAFAVRHVGTHRILEREEQEAREREIANAAAAQRAQEEEERARDEEEQKQARQKEQYRRRSRSSKPEQP